jgi:hypothetical protein
MRLTGSTSPRPYMAIAVVCFLGNTEEHLDVSCRRRIDAPQAIDRTCSGARRGIVMGAQSHSVAFKLPAQSNSLGVTSTLRCDHCRMELGHSVHCYCHMQFCSSACMTAYQQRLAPETKEKICRLDVLPSEDQISGSNLSQLRVSWLALWGF